MANTTSSMNGSSNFCPVLQRQEVDAAFERHDPAVQQIARRAPLPAEVVDDQHAAVGDRLDRRACRSRSSSSTRAPAIRASTRRRPSPAAAGTAPSGVVPSSIERQAVAVVFGRDRLVVDRIEQPDDVAFDFERVRNGEFPVEQIREWPGR